MTLKAPSISALWRWLDRWQPSGTLVLGGAALIVGLATGVGVWLFKAGIVLIKDFMFGWLDSWVRPLAGDWNWTLIAVPIVGGVIVGLMIQYIIGPERRHGVSGIMEAVALAGGRIRYWRVPAKALASAVSIGSGASVGPEDPSVQIGASLGSMFGQVLRLSDQRVRALVAAGAASGIAAAFNAPIAGVFFALEIILGEIGGSALGVTVLAAVVAAAFTQAVSGAEPAFIVPHYVLHSAWELPLYLGLGLVGGLVASLYIRLLYTATDAFHDMNVPRWVKPAIAGAMVGAVGIFLPQAFGVGYSAIGGILNSGSSQPVILWLVLAMLVAKLVLTPISIGGGFQGGVFAPSLFLGVMLGGAYGYVAQLLFPGLHIAPAAFAMVGMAAVLAGAVHAPLTAILLLFEMTNDYRIILPLMFAVAVSMFVSQRIQRDSVYTLGLARKGVRIDSGRDVEVLEAMTVGEVMQRNMPTLREDDTLEEASNRFLRLHYNGMPVLNARGDLVGVITVQDIDRAQSPEGGGTTVGDACTRDLLLAYPDETLGTVLRRMSVRDIGRLPVVARGNPNRLLGLLRRAEVIRAYDTALARRVALRHRAQQARLGSLSDVSVEEFIVQRGSLAEGQTISQVNWPRDCVIATLRRGRHLHIPHGDTVIEAGDVLATVVDGQSATDAMNRLVRRGATRDAQNPVPNSAPAGIAEKAEE